MSSVKASEGIQGQWGSGNPEEEKDGGSLGKDGKLSWMCEIPAQGSSAIALQWEVNVPANMVHQVEGL